ncbi:helix-turn-helix transcriptional regulator [Mangrovicoccus ximenensis]|uniref:helix-turn-helix transcriptional regulator n=1 Tax=Mangrovicoccus ximenensis TaxID=1911570 RepID=UPI00191BF799|nr:LuxR family transcriptional regulator [Mangrovicoccus ximenensis]
MSAANDLIDIADMLGAAGSAEAGWLASRRAAERLGFAAVNAAGIFSGTGEIAWVRHGMRAGWVEAYCGQRMHEVDPAVAWAVSDRMEGRFSAADVRSAPAGRRADEMADLLEDHAYRHLLCRKWAEGSVTKAVLLCTEAPPELSLRPETLAILPAVSAMMAVRIGAPQDCAGALGVEYRHLSGRERDVLGFLAAGLDNQQIAERLGLAEVTVRMHMAKARRKMGAATREQALALAMARGMLAL